jgi:uncharacterized membrane protein YwaF
MLYGDVLLHARLLKNHCGQKLPPATWKASLNFLCPASILRFTLLMHLSLLFEYCYFLQVPTGLTWAS